jgi:hypothetical protein
MTARFGYEVSFQQRMAGIVLALIGQPAAFRSEVNNRFNRIESPAWIEYCLICRPSNYSLGVFEGKMKVREILDEKHVHGADHQSAAGNQ